MAQFNTSAGGVVGWTPAGFAEGATLTNSNYQALRAWTQYAADRITEVFIGGMATSSTVNYMAIRRHQTQAVTPTNVQPATMNIASVNCSAQGFVLAATGSVLAAANTPGHLLNLAFNAFGGVIRWVAAPGEEMWIIGAGANASANCEVSLSSATGTGLVATHMIFEEM